MANNRISLRRRRLLQGLATLAMPWPFVSRALAADRSPIQHTIPASGERIVAIGMGTWLSFGIDPDDQQAMTVRKNVLQTFFEMGGQVIDSSPMYGTAEEVIGKTLQQLDAPPKLFSATKVWTSGWQAGVRQMERSQLLWGVKRFDLMQVHNLLDWQTHLETLKGWKEEGRIRYIGVTTSHGRRHDELEAIMQDETIDFVQLTYNLRDREAEQRLLPLAAERGIAVLANRPFQGGGLFRRYDGHPLPDWAAEFDCQNWAQYFLKFVISHPSITCAIPATSQVAHMRENMGAAYGSLPDATMRRRMLDYVNNL